MLRIVVFSFFTSAIVLANETPHSIGLESSYSKIDNGSGEDTSDLKDITTSHYAYSYQYKITEHVSIGIGYLKRDSSNVDGGFLDIFTDSKIDYSVFLISAAINYPISKRNYLYLKTNSLNYDFDIIDDNGVCQTRCRLVR